MLGIVCAIIVAAAGTDLLVSTSQVADLKDSLLVDARPLEAYTAGHIPKAISLDVSTFSEKRGDVAGLLKPLETVRGILADAGVDPAKRIVVYSAMESAGDLTAAARIFWTLEYVGYKKVAVLDGGYAKWVAEKRAVEQGAPNYTPITMPELDVREDLLATADNVDMLVKNGDGVIADIRGSEYFRGEKKSDVAKEAGHIPGAVNLPGEDFVDSESKSLKSWEELKAIAQSGGVSGKEPVVTYCNTGRSASTGYLVLRILGYDVSMYDGSMAEWTATGDRKVETGDATKKN